MSTQLLLVLTPSSFPIPNPTHLPTLRRSYTAAVSKGSRYGFDLDGDEDHEDDEGSFVFDGGPNKKKKKKKKRVWWSELDGSEAEEEEEEEKEFGHATEEQFWGFKVLAAFGWMVPAVGISLLLGTGPNAFFMALAVPLGQRLISLAFDKAVGMAGDAASKHRYRPAKARRKPYRKAKTDAQTRRQESGSGRERNGYRSWAAADASYRSVGHEGKSRYGGWDDLDDKSRVSKTGIDASAPRRDSDGRFRPQRKSKSRNRVRRGNEMPLLMRLLIAAFPFLGFWTRLF